NGEESLTYRQLNERANSLAHYLKNRLPQNGDEPLVGIMLKRSTDMVVAMLAALKVGGAYVPLDPSYPQERLKFMIEDTSIGLLVTDNELRERVGDFVAQVVVLDEETDQIATESHENLGTAVTAENLAYVMYTSGSTGQPK